MLLNEYINENQKNIKTYQHKNPKEANEDNPKLFLGIYVNKDEVLKYKSIGIHDDPLAKEDSEIKVLKGQTIVLFEQPITLSSRNIENYKVVEPNALLSEHIKDLLNKIESGILPPSINLLEKYHGKEDASTQNNKPVVKNKR